MTEELTANIELADLYYTSSVKCLTTMRSARTYATINEATTKVDEYILSLLSKVEALYETIETEITEESSSITDKEYIDIVNALNNISRAIVNLNKANEIYEEVYNALNGVEEVVSAKKTTKVNEYGKTVSKTYTNR